MDDTHYTPMMIGDLYPRKLEGASVYDSAGKRAGRVARLRLPAEGGGAVIISSGGFLGIGAKEFTVSTDDIVFMRNANGNVRGVLKERAASPPLAHP